MVQGQSPRVRIEVLGKTNPIAVKAGLKKSDFDQTIAVNLKSAFLCTQAVLPGMRARRWGRILA